MRSILFRAAFVLLGTAVGLPAPADARPAQRRADLNALTVTGCRHYVGGPYIAIAEAHPNR